MAAEETHTTEDELARCNHGPTASERRGKAIVAFCPGVILQWKREEGRREGQSSAISALSSASIGPFEVLVCPQAGAPCVGVGLPSTHWPLKQPPIGAVSNQPRPPGEGHRKPCLCVISSYLCTFRSGTVIHQDSVMHF